MCCVVVCVLCGGVHVVWWCACCIVVCMLCGGVRVALWCACCTVVVCVLYCGVHVVWWCACCIVVCTCKKCELSMYNSRLVSRRKFKLFSLHIVYSLVPAHMYAHMYRRFWLLAVYCTCVNSRLCTDGFHTCLSVRVCHLCFKPYSVAGQAGESTAQTNRLLVTPTGLFLMAILCMISGVSSVVYPLVLPSVLSHH